MNKTLIEVFIIKKRLNLIVGIVLNLKKKYKSYFF